MKIKYLITTTIVSFALSSPAIAADTAALEKRIKDLESKINKLEKIIDQQDKKISTAITPRQKVGAKDDEIEITFAPLPKFKSKDGSFSFTPTGKVQADAAVFKDDKADHPDGTTFRRARLGFKGHMYNDWEYKAEVDFANNATAITDAYLGYTGIDQTLIQVGQFKEPFSMDELTSSSDIMFIERASPNAFAPGRNIGAGVTYQGDKWLAQAGAFGANAGTASSDDEAKSVTGRVTITPVKEKDRIVHVGAAASYRSPDSAADSVGYSNRPETRIASIRSVNTGTVTMVDNILLTGLEVAGGYDSFNFQAEWMNADVSREAMTDAGFSGWYAQGSYILTGEKKPYSGSKGVFKRVSPASPFSLQDNTIGAWEVAARYSNLDLNDSAISGGEMDNVTFGLNWYPNDDVRFMANYILVDTDSNATVADDSPQIFTIRSQFTF